MRRRVNDLSVMPEMGTIQHFLNPRFAGIRRWRIRSFEKYLIFYRPLEDGIEVVRVIHAARDIESIFEDTNE
jgi:toxin ParE1/3/4